MPGGNTRPEPGHSSAGFDMCWRVLAVLQNLQPLLQCVDLCLGGIAKQGNNKCQRAAKPTQHGDATRGAAKFTQDGDAKRGAAKPMQDDGHAKRVKTNSE